MARPRALAYLGWRALIAHPLKILFRRRTGLERFRESYFTEGLAPARQVDRVLERAASACIACGLCEIGCELTAAAPEVRALGLHSSFRLYSRSFADLPLAAEALEACAGCDARCPMRVPIARIVAHLRESVTTACRPT